MVALDLYRLFSITRYLRDLALYAASLSLRQRDISPGDLRSFRSFTATASLGTHPPDPARVRAAACKRYSRVARLRPVEAS